MSNSRNPACRLPLILALAFFLGLMSSATAVAQSSSVNFQVSTSGRLDCESPIQLKNIPIGVRITGALNTDGNGTADLTETAFILSTTIHFEGRLGARPAAAPGGTTQVRVSGPRSLMLTWNLPNNQFIVHIMVSGQSCSASIDARLKPGKSQYTIFDGSIFHYCGRPRFEGTSCQVQ